MHILKGNDSVFLEKYLLLAEVEDSDGFREFGPQLVAAGAARLVDQKKYRLSGNLSLVEAFSQTSPFVHPPEVVFRIIVGRDHVTEQITRQSDEIQRAEALRITHNREFSPSKTFNVISRHCTCHVLRFEFSRCEPHRAEYARFKILRCTSRGSQTAYACHLSAMRDRGDSCDVIER